MPTPKRSVSFWRASTRDNPRPAAFVPASRWRGTAFDRWTADERANLRRALSDHRRAYPSATNDELADFARRWAKRTGRPKAAAVNTADVLRLLGRQRARSAAASRPAKAQTRSLDLKSLTDDELRAIFTRRAADEMRSRLEKRKRPRKAKQRRKAAPSDARGSRGVPRQRPGGGCRRLGLTERIRRWDRRSTRTPPRHEDPPEQVDRRRRPCSPLPGGVGHSDRSPPSGSGAGQLSPVLIGIAGMRPRPESAR